MKRKGDWQYAKAADAVQYILVILLFFVLDTTVKLRYNGLG